MKLKRIETEEEYWKKHKEYKKKINKLFRKSYKFLTDPLGFVNEFENILAEMEFIGLVSMEWTQGQRERLYREMNKPSEFKQWIIDSRENIRNKFKRESNIDIELNTDNLDGLYDKAKVNQESGKLKRLKQK